MLFGKRLKELRKQSQYSMDELVEIYNTKFQGKMNKSTLSRYENGLQEPMYTVVVNLAKLFNVSVDYLSGSEINIENFEKYGLRPIETKKFPMLGNIACGEPIIANQEFETFVEASANIRADFCLTARGDSMINANIHNGDVVFIKQQPDVDNGKIAAVLIDDEVTLKRIYKSDNALTLIAENPEYNPLVYTEQSGVTIKILGKAVAVQSLIK